jgi:YidC/Oxa1 family membrane protein insertase
VLTWLYKIVAKAIIIIHDGLAPIFGKNSGVTWTLSIILLVVAMRLLLYPVFAKQFKSQRRMMDLQPKVKALQDKYKNDRQKLAEEQMKLFRENNVNPFAACLPVLLQAPIFLALFRVLTSFKPEADGNTFKAHYGVPSDLVESAAKARVFGAPLSVGFKSTTERIEHLGASPGTVRLVAVIIILAMTVAQFLASKQMMSRNAAQANTSMAQQQKIMLYVLPLMFGGFAFIYPTPMGVLIYWLTTNLWSFGQQQLLLRHMHGPDEPGRGGKAVTNPKSPGGTPNGAMATTPKSTDAKASGSTAQVRRQPVRNSRTARRGKR